MAAYIDVPISFTSHAELIDAKRFLASNSDLELVFDSGKANIRLTSVDMLPLRDAIEKRDNPALKQFYASLESIRSFGVKSGKRVYAGYKDERKVANRDAKKAQRLGYQDFSKEFTTLNQDIPNRYLNKILCADSEKTLCDLPDNCIDIIFTSPPYNFGLSYEGHNDTSKWTAYFDKLFAIFKECVRVLKYGGRIIVNVQPLFSDYIPSHHLISRFFFDSGLIWKGEILWEKNNYNCKYTSWGSWKSPSSPYLKYTWEFLEIFCKGDLKKNGNPDYADITADEFKSWVNAKWSISPERNMKKFGHPAMFPEELASRVLKLFSFKNDIVLDPFNGVGTTTLAALKLQRRFLGIDVSSDYCAVAAKRMKLAKEGGSFDVSLEKSA